MEKTGDLISQRKIRLEKAEELKKRGFKPYPSKVAKGNSTKQIIKNYDDFEGAEVDIAGRLMTWREHGKLIFGDLQDADGSIQLYIKQNEINPSNTDTQNLGWKNLDLVDIGDFVKVHGVVTKTKRGEISVLVKELMIAAKAIRPLPEKWAGLKDKELRFRRRYLDMTMNPEVRDLMKRRSKFWQAHREYLNAQGFTEVNIPVLEHIPGGGDATPFVTHMNAIDEDFYLRISHELPLKRLLGAGFEKVYDIGPRFRNEGLSDEHLPEHVAFEYYWAYANWEDGMKLVQELTNHVVSEVYDGQKIFEIRGHTVDFNNWDIIDFQEVMGDNFGIDIYNPDLKKIKKELEKANVEIDFALNIPRAVDNLWKVLRKEIAGPAFLINHPIYLSPLQKPSEDNPMKVERFQPIIAGSEAGNGWSEVNNPINQLDRFVEQQRMRNAGDAEAQWLDIDYVEMLEYGMPPAVGYGHAERNFWFFEDVSAREGVPFPQLKQQLEPNTIKIYSEIKDLIEDPQKEANEIRETKSDKSTIDTVSLDDYPEADVAEIDPEIKKKFPGIKFGYLILEDVKVSKSSEKFNKLKNEITEEIRNQYENTSKIKETERIEGFREIYKKFGVDPNSRLNSAEALIRRIVSGKGIYDINNIVNIYNLTSAELELPMAAYDLGDVEGKIKLSFAKEGDEIVRIGDKAPTEIRKGEMVYKDEEGVICMDYNYRDANRTKIESDTNKIVIFVDGHEGVSEEDIAKALELLASRILSFTEAKITGRGIVT